MFTFACTINASPYYPMPVWAQKLPAPDRFLVLADWNNEVVLDRDTGLVWDINAGVQSGTWVNAMRACRLSALGNRRGFSAAEL